MTTEQPAASTRPSAKVFVGGLSWTTDDVKLRQYFENFGSVLEAFVSYDRTTGRPRGFGFVVFESFEVADKVVASKHTIDRREVEAKKAVPKEESPAPQQAPADPSAPQKTRKVFVGGLAATVDEQVLRQYFEQFGAVEDAVVMYDHDNKRPRGFGFITFVDEDSVDKVFAAGAMQNIHEKQIEIKPAVPRDQMPLVRRGAMPHYPPGPRGPAPAQYGPGPPRGGNMGPPYPPYGRHHGGSSGGYHAHMAPPPAPHYAQSHRGYSGGAGPSSRPPAPYTGAPGPYGSGGMGGGGGYSHTQHTHHTQHAYRGGGSPQNGRPGGEGVAGAYGGLGADPSAFHHSGVAPPGAQRAFAPSGGGGAGPPGARFASPASNAAARGGMPGGAGGGAGALSYAAPGGMSGYNAALGMLTGAGPFQDASVYAQVQLSQLQQQNLHQQMNGFGAAAAADFGAGAADFGGTAADVVDVTGKFGQLGRDMGIRPTLNAGGAPFGSYPSPQHPDSGGGYAADGAGGFEAAAAASAAASAAAAAAAGGFGGTDGGVGLGPRPGALGNSPEFTAFDGGFGAGAAPGWSA